MIKLNKKAMELQWNYLFYAIILILALILILPTSSKIGEIGSEGINMFGDRQCNIAPELCENEIILDEIERRNLFEPVTVSLSDKASLQILQEFSDKHLIELEKLKAFIAIESSAQPFDDDHPTVRFECLKFNEASPKKAPCEISNRFPFGKPSDTDYDAFKNALEINKELTLSSSSYGLGQIMGFNYKEVGYNSVEEYYLAMFEEKNQVDAFLIFLKKYRSGVILDELKKTNTNWVVIAKNYNGEAYEKNDYHTKLKTKYQEYKLSS